MLYMVIENFKGRSASRIYQRFDKHGRMTPEGLKYINSWVDAEVTRCFQLMECEDAKILEEWTEKWSDLVDFEIVPLVSSEEAKTKALLDG